MADALTTRWSARALDALRTAPVVPRTLLADLSPTRELDDELFELTGRRGMPVIDGITLAYPATLDAPTKDCVHGFCVWGRGNREIRLTERPDGAWETSDLGSTISWRACVELLVLEQQYRSWIPVFVCKDVLSTLPRRWGRDLAQALGLDAIESVDNVFADDEIMCWDSQFFVRSIDGAARVLERCNALGFSASMSARDARLVFVDEIERCGAHERRLEHRHRGKGNEDVVVSIFARETIQQDWILGEQILETVKATPACVDRIRRNPPALGSDRLREYFRRYAISLPAVPPCVAAPAAMADASDELRPLGRTLLLRPGEGNMWLGLWRIEDLPDPARRATPKAIAAAPGAPQITRTEWPYYRWGELDMVCVGGGSECELYLRDANGAVWFCDVAYGHFEFICGGMITWLERLAIQSSLDAAGHESPLLTIPLKEWGELPEAFDVPLVPECSDSRARLYASAVYTIWESSPTQGIPVVDVRARSSRELISIVRWARRRWGTAKMAVAVSDASTQELDEAMRAENVQILDGETGGWKTASFWDS